MAFFDNNLITREEVLEITGINPENIQDDDNPSNKVERLIAKAQDMLIAYVGKNYRNDLVRWYHNKMSSDERTRVKIAIALQVEYIILNGDIGSESLMYYNSRNITKNGAIKISPNAIDQLSLIKKLCQNNISKSNAIADFLEIELHGY